MEDLFLEEMQRWCEANTKRQKLVAIARDRTRSLYVRLSALEEYSRCFDPTVMQRLHALLESKGAMRH